MPKQRPSKRDEQRTDRLRNRAQNGPEGPLAEDDTIDAAIKHSIDKFGA